MKAQRLLAFALLASLLIGSGQGVAQADGEWMPPPVLLETMDAADPPPGGDAPSGWWASVQDDIRRSEYTVTWQDQTYLPDLPASYQAPNRAHNLRIYFPADTSGSGALSVHEASAGLRVLPRAGDTSAWEWGLAFTGYGYEGAIQPAPDAKQVVLGNRVEYHRAASHAAAGALIEWYVNDERGLEQGFTLASRPPGAPHAVGAHGRAPLRRAPLQIEMALTGDLVPTLTEDEAAIEFTTPDGVRVLRYGHLYAYDATGRPLPAHLSLVSTEPVAQNTKHALRTMHYTIRITLDDTHAAYPITLDPLLTSPSWTAESDQAQALMGASVSTAGDVNDDGYDDVLVGAPRYDGGQRDMGRAFVYLGSASGLAASAAWTVESDTQDAQLGSSVDTAGDVNGDGYDDVIVGAVAYQGAHWREGRAYVYHGSASGLETTPAWTVQGGQSAAQLGASVSAAGDVNGDGYDDVIVGSLGHYDSLTNVGRAYVYHGSASGLSASADWMIQGAEPGARLGTSVDGAGDVNDDGYADVIVGAPGLDDQSPLTGRAYVYHGSATGLDSNAPDWTGTSGQADDRFGFSVSMAGDVNGDGYDDIVIGAPGDDEDNPLTGQVYVYQGSSKGLSAGSPDWAITSEQAKDHLGGTVGAAGDVNGDGYGDLVVGAPRYDGDQVDEGQVRVYYGSPSGPHATPDWTAYGNQNDAGLGTAVGTAGDVNGDGYADVIAGAPYYDAGQDNEGRAFLYYGPMPALGTTPGWTANGDRQEAQLGFSVNTAGDVNGDGYSDVLIGAPFYDGGQSNEGRAYLYLGDAAGLLSAPAWQAESDQVDAYLGASVSTAGDVNGDGYDDIVIGASTYDNGQTDEGRAYIYHGSALGLSVTADWTAESNQDGAWFGFPVGAAGDVNGDGYADVLVGARYYDGGQKNEGRVYVYHGSASGLGATANWTAESNQADAEYGHAASTAGDLNGDGYTDLVVGAPYYDGGQPNEGRAYVYYGSASGLSATADWTAEGNQWRAEYGRAVDTAGDVNGDGYADLIVGAPKYNSGQKDEGRVYVYHGHSAGLTSTPAWTSESEQVKAQYGHAVSGAGDVNGDGYADVVIGAPTFDTVYEDGGRAFVYYGGPAGLLEGLPDWAAESGQAGAQFGTSVGAAGDVNGDGYADLIVGAPYYDDGQTDEGRAYLFYGSALGQLSPGDWTTAGEPYVEYSWDWFGKSVRPAGDVNGDGYGDVIVGAPSYDGGLENQGRVHLFLGSVSGLSTTAHWTMAGDYEAGWFGISAGTAGDVNGDGYSDVIVGEAGRPIGNDQFTGRAYVYRGSPTGLETTPAWSVQDDQVGTLFGRAVSTAGDVNGDGYADVIIGAPDSDTAQQDAGKATVYLGSPSGLGASPAWTAQGTQTNANFGQSVGTAGDANGDGYSEVIVGAPGVGYVGQEVNGRAFVYHGSSSGLHATAGWTVQHEQASALFGTGVSTAGDVNGDGYADVIVGAPGYNATEWEELEGQAAVYLGSPAGLSVTAGWTAEGTRAEEVLGTSVSTAGDVNGDGYADVIVGAPTYLGIDGRAYLYLGSSTGLGASPQEWTTDNGYETGYGDSVSTAGDVNGDGYADLAIGAPGSGRAYVRYGSGTGVSLIPRQRRADDSAPIAHLGRAGGSAFRLAALGRTPFGRGKVQLEWEIKPLGTLFDGAGTGRSAAWVDSGVSGAQLNERMGDLQASTAYHWRVRLRYHPATTPFQPYSRWLTVPRNGWNEQDLRTGAPAVGFDAAAYSALESGGKATVTVTLNAASSLPAAVSVTASDGTATAGEDYTATSETLTFDPGERTQTVVVPLLDDAEVEADETVLLTLTDATGAFIAGTNPVTLTIRDDDRPAVVHFQQATYQAGEDAGTASIAVILDSPSSHTITVACATSGGTATAGEDYAAVQDTLTFIPGQTARTCAVPLLDDKVREEDETVILTLSNAVNASIAGPNPATLTLVDDDIFDRYLPLVSRRAPSAP